MKVGFFNRKLWNEYCNIISLICGAFSFLVIFIDIPVRIKLVIGLIFLVVLLVIYAVLFIKANRKKETVLIINQNKFIIKFGDLFSEKGLKTIAFNEYFDTEVNDELVYSNTINGFYLKPV